MPLCLLVDIISRAGPYRYLLMIINTNAYIFTLLLILLSGYYYFIYSGPYSPKYSLLLAWAVAFYMQILHFIIIIS